MTGPRTRSVRRLATTALLCALGVLPATAGAATPVAKRTLKLDVVTGPDRDRRCVVDADLYVPQTATAATPAPAVLLTNGFNGSKADPAATARQLAERGYVTLSYSGLGFGQTSCPITIDDPDWDGVAASQLITFLGGGSAAQDGTRVDVVRRDAVAHDGRHHASDPRVGMVGGSYGGGIQFATASVDPRLDTIVPQITWNDLRYSLFPQNAGLDGTSLAHDEPGVGKTVILAGLIGVGIVDGVAKVGADQASLLSSCPNYLPEICVGLAEGTLTGVPSSSFAARLRHASVAGYLDRIRIPVFLQQGEGDTFFNLRESVATYTALRGRGVPVKLQWQSWGHSHPSPAPGEYATTGLTTDGTLTYQGRHIVEWFDHYLKDDPAAPALDFSVFRPWVRYPGLDAGKAWAAAPAYPVTDRPATLRLSGSGELADDGATPKAGSAAFVSTGTAGSFSDVPLANTGGTPVDVPGTAATFRSAPLTRDRDLIGIPHLTVRIAAPSVTATAGGGATGVSLFLKLYDEAPDGTQTLPAATIAPVRLSAQMLERPVSIDLAGMVHRFAKGHRIVLVIAGSDAAYRGTTVPTPVTVQAAGGVLQLPFVEDAALQRPRFATVPATPRPRIVVRVVGQRGRGRGVLLRVQRTGPALKRVTFELRRRGAVVARSTPRRIAAGARDVVLRRRTTARLPRGSYVLVVRRGSTVILRRTVRLPDAR